MSVLLCRSADNRVVVREIPRDSTTGRYADIPCYGALALLPAICLGKLRVRTLRVAGMLTRTLRCNQCGNAMAIVGESLNAREAAERAEE